MGTGARGKSSKFYHISQVVTVGSGDWQIYRVSYRVSYRISYLGIILREYQTYLRYYPSSLCLWSSLIDLHDPQAMSLNSNVEEYRHVFSPSGFKCAFGLYQSMFHAYCCLEADHQTRRLSQPLLALHP